MIAAALSAPRPANLTRRSSSFVAKFWRQRQFHLIPLYWLLRQSDFAREGMHHSGSYLFADHMYRDVASGSTWLGRVLDRLLLNLPATRSMRSRCAEARQAMSQRFQEYLQSGEQGTFRLVTAPCGLPRDVRDFAAQLHRSHASALRNVRYVGVDLDPSVLAAAREFLRDSPVDHNHLVQADALEGLGEEAADAHFISSTGLGEFLDDIALAQFYRNIFASLRPGGTFFTSAAACGRFSAQLLRHFELEVNYRDRPDLERILRTQAWSNLEFWHDEVGLQTFVRARK